MSGQLFSTSRIVSPVQWRKLTFASRIMLPTYPAVFAWVGTVFIAQDPSRTATAVFETAKKLMPIELWGLIFLAIAVVEIVSLLTNRADVYIAALIAGTGLTAFWTVLIINGAFASDYVSWSIAGWMVLAIIAQIASARSLALDYLGRGLPNDEPPEHS